MWHTLLEVVHWLGTWCLLMWIGVGLHCLWEQFKIEREQRRGKVGNTCRSCGKPMLAGSDTCSDCYGDPNHA